MEALVNKTVIEISKTKKHLYIINRFQLKLLNNIIKGERLILLSTLIIALLYKLYKLPIAGDYFLSFDDLLKVVCDVYIKQKFSFCDGSGRHLRYGYCTGTVQVLYRPWAKAMLCHLTTYYVYSSPLPPLPSSSFLSFKYLQSSPIVQVQVKTSPYSKVYPSVTCRPVTLSKALLLRLRRPLIISLTPIVF